MKRALLVLMVFAAAGVIAFTINSLRHDAISDYINRKWAPVNVDQQRQQSIATAAQSLSSLTGANVAFGAEIADLENAANTPALKALGVSRLRFRGEDQLIRIEADFDRRFEDDPAVDASARKLLQTLSPQITGSVLVYAGITSGTLVETPNTVELPLMILPAFKSINVQKVVLTGKTDATMVGDLLASVLNRYADNVSGVLSRAPMTALKVPATFVGSLNPSQVIRIDSPDVKADVTLEANTVHAPIKLLGIAWLITAKQLMALGAFVPIDNPAAQPGMTILPTYQDIKTQFEAMITGAFDLPSKPNGSWFAIRKDLIALTANNAIRDAALSISGTARMPQQRLNKEIAFPDETTVDCTPTRACDAERACNFPPNHDERGCNVCLLHNPFGGCIVRGNDPVCEAAKATQNKIYEADAAAKKFDCERLKAQEKGTCELEKAGQKALCETGKELLKRLARTGKFANIDASIRARTNNLRLTLKSFALSPELNKLHVSVEVTGRASADVSLKFIPLDIVGHLACQAPWTENQTFEAQLRDSLLSISSDLQFVTDGINAGVRFEVPGSTVPLHLEPSPTEFFIKSVNMTIACQGLNLVKPLALTLTPFLPELRGDIDYKYDKQSGTIALPVPSQTLGALQVSGTIKDSAKALFLFGSVATAK